MSAPIWNRFFEEANIPVDLQEKSKSLAQFLARYVEGDNKIVLISVSVCFVGKYFRLIGPTLSLFRFERY